MLKFLADQNLMWGKCDRDVLAAFDLSPFRQVCDLGGGHQQVFFNKPLNCLLLQALKRKITPMLEDWYSNEKQDISPNPVSNKGSVYCLGWVKKRNVRVVRTLGISAFFFTEADFCE